MTQDDPRVTQDDPQVTAVRRPFIPPLARDSSSVCIGHHDVKISLYRHMESHLSLLTLVGFGCIFHWSLGCIWLQVDPVGNNFGNRYGGY